MKVLSRKEKLVMGRNDEKIFLECFVMTRTTAFVKTRAMAKQ